METTQTIYESREAVHRAIWDAGFRLDKDYDVKSIRNQFWTNRSGQYIRVLISGDDQVTGTRHVRFIGGAAIHSPGFEWDRD